MVVSVSLLILGLLLLLAGGGALVKGASGLAGRYGVPPLVIGLTVVAFGTSAPELVVNLVGAVKNQTELAFGNVAGSNLANIGLVLGISALIRPIAIEGQIIRRELPLLLLGSAVLLVLTMDLWIEGTPSIINRSNSIVLLLLFTIFLYITIADFLKSDGDPLSNAGEALTLPAQSADWLYSAGGIVALAIGGQLTITHGAQLATFLGVSPIIIGLLVVAIGTSMPELVTSVIAAIRRESDLCVGNVVGSNIFNGLFVLPLSGLVRPLPVPEGGSLDIFVSLLFALVIIPVFYFGSGRMTRPIAIAMLLAYATYMWMRVTG